MYNKVILAGNIARDPEIRYAQSGSAICNTSIATNRKWKDQSGEQKEEVMFIDLTFFGRIAEIADQYLHKGSKVLVEGRLKLEQWMAQDGTKRSKHVVVVESMKMLDSKESSPRQQENDQPSQPTPRQQEYGQAQPAPSVPEIDVDSEQIPF